MTRTMRILLLIFLMPLWSLMNAGPVFAIPPLPSSFYGTVKLNNANVPNGTLVQALVDGNLFAEAYTNTYDGNSVFALDVPGDDSSTAAQEGGKDGDTIQFKVGGVLAKEMGTWRGATNTNLDLTLSVAESKPLNTPRATPSPLPTQTAIIRPKPTRTPTARVQPTAVNNASVDPSPMPTLHVEPTSRSVGIVKPMEEADPGVHPSPASAGSAGEPQAGAPTAASENTNSVNLLGSSVLILILLGVGFWIVRRRLGIPQRQS